MTKVFLPDTTDGKISTFFGSWIRRVTEGVNPAETIYEEASVYALARVTTDGKIRVRGEVPSDLNPQNDEAFDPPHPNYLICDRTGFKVSRHEGLKEEWDGSLVRAESWEPRHPQDFVRSRAETQRGSPRPEQEDVFISDEYGQSGVSLEDLDG